MGKILFISERRDKIQKLAHIFDKKPYDFFTTPDKNIVLEMLNISCPDVFIFDNKLTNIKQIIKDIKSRVTSPAFILLTEDKKHEPELIKYINAFITEDLSDDMISYIVNANLKTKSSLEQLSDTNKDLADSLYRLNVLYSTSSQFAGSLDKHKLLKYMIDGLDKSLSFDLTCTLYLDTEPVLLLNSLYEISDELLKEITSRTIANYNSLFKDGKKPAEINSDNLKVIKNVKYNAKSHTFSLLQFDNMFASINSGNDFFGCIEIFKETSFSSDDASCFQTIVQQVALPLKSATLYQEIIETNHKLEKLEKLKSEFISIVSHELRTPLTAIKNSIDILTSGTCGELNETGTKFLSMATRNVGRLTDIINDLLDLSKIEAGKMEYHFENVNIHNIIEDVKISQGGIAKKHNINIISKETNNLPEIYADAKRLDQVLTNLVSNAIKFTPEGKTITINSTITNAMQLKTNECFNKELKKLSGDYVVVCVEDEGIGIAESDLLRIFDKFAQIESSLSRKVNGSGLGLPIAKQLLEAHNGTIWCESELNKGSKFYFAIPITQSAVLN